MLKKITALCLILPFVAYADSGVGAAVAAAMATQVVNTGSAVYMQSHGMQPQYITTPYGIYVLPKQNSSTTSTSTSSSGSTASAHQNVPTVTQPSEYELQNQQQNKVQFFNGTVVQAFPNTPGNTGTNS